MCIRDRSRTTRKAEFVRAALECIAYQITDVVPVSYTHLAGVRLFEREALWRQPVPYNDGGC